MFSHTSGMDKYIIMSEYPTREICGSINIQTNDMRCNPIRDRLDRHSLVTNWESHKNHWLLIVYISQTLSLEMYEIVVLLFHFQILLMLWLIAINADIHQNILVLILCELK